ncbi:DNA translocase FtsK [Peribacillus sp. TH16]|uniref:FtsK/SpoIIIE domain-containing protein n=1 Tax=Peribacillus sp. TH16 TaxID=2798482 RepID=UPI001914A455|nr:FtsK/SpoIIIE domain-containing protein [Peribacillus sp. TH16]MBK5482986.1 DNA translocase FtsK [Peribacillus sp. TH16]
MKMWLAKQKAKAELLKAFRNGEIGNHYSYSSNSGLIYPKIHSVQFDNKKKTLMYVFTLPTGMDPKEVMKKEYCFKQVFGERIELKGDIKKFTLTVFTAPIPNLVRYKAERFVEQAKNAKLPIVCGVDMNGQNVVYDMVEHPHLLIAGETGSGKSTQLRSILTSLITMIDPKRLQLFLCDLKRSEFHLFRRIEHVEAVLVSPVDMLPMLIHLREETTKRGDLLDAHEVAHIDDLPDPPPYIILCIDEVALLKKEKKIMDIIEEISAIGRALGIYLILSMQRPDAKLLEGALKNNLTVRMGFKCADLINARIIGTPGSEKIKQDGRMLLKLQGQDELKEIQAPYLVVKEAKKILESHKYPVTKNTEKGPSKRSDDPEIIDTIFEVLD